MRSTLLSLLFFSTLSGPLAHAANFSFQGTLANDSSIQLVNFTLDAPTTVTIQTFSYAGGVDAVGGTIASGGFDPLISLYDASSALINENDDGPTSAPDPVTGQRFDVDLSTALSAGTYTIALGQYDNFGNGPTLSAGFAETDPNFTALFGCSNGQFCDVTGDNRSNAWELSISNASTASLATAAVPEPGMLGLFTIGLSLLGVTGGRKLLTKR